MHKDEKRGHTVRNMKGFFDFSIGPEAEGFGRFSAVHGAYLTAAALCALLLCLVCRCSDAEKRRLLRRGVASAALALELLRAVLMMITGHYTIGRLPLHLCAMAVYISFFHAFRGGRLTGQFLYAFCMPGAAAALLFPDWSGYPALHFMTVCSFALHILVFAYILMQVPCGDIRPDAKSLPQCLGVMLAVAIPVYVFDILTNTNYLFLNWPSPGSPLDLFAFLGRPGYLLGYIPLIAGVWIILYLPFVLKNKKSTG